MPNVKIIDDPMTATAKPAASGKNAKEEVFVWINNAIFAASPQIESLRGFANTLNAPAANRFVASSFHQRISDVYKDGAGLVVAADLEKIVAKLASKENGPDADRQREGLK